jgi:hypothetical protein
MNGRVLLGEDSTMDAENVIAVECESCGGEMLCCPDCHYRICKACGIGGSECSHEDAF